MKKKGAILIVDDNNDILVALRLFLSRYFDRVLTEKNPELIPSLVEKENLDVIILDMNFKAGINSGNEGIYWMNVIRKSDPHVSIVFITAFAAIELAVNAMKQGATDFIEKPWDDEKMLATILKAFELKRSKTEITSLREKQKHLNEHIDTQYDFFRGQSPAMQSVYNTIEKVAPTDASILILGENGTGKEIIARAIHRMSARAKEVFISVDLGALSASLFESELFGHVKGAFTDAREDRPGRMEIASGGTLFLDEIGNLPLTMQPKLLSVLQNQVVSRVGSNKMNQIDVRLICATNCPLFDMAEKGQFREDLLYRINTIHLELPPLRERKEDILPFFDFFVRKYAKKYNKTIHGMDKQAEKQLLAWSWPGNIRELQHMAEKAVIMCDGNTIEPKDLFAGTAAKKKPSLHEILNLNLLEKEAISRALEKSGGNITKAARELGISRRTFYYKTKHNDQ